MLDPSIVEQLRTHFASLEGNYSLVVSPSEHPRQPELRALLDDLASASVNIQVVERGPARSVPFFVLERNGEPTGVGFHGIPGGHEFSSLVLAILNADGKGKLPDAAIVERMRRLRGPIDLRTYVSLSCTNCPDVVQALNLVALVHGDVGHTMVDGALAPEEIAELGIQAVPSVFAGDRLLHVGKSSLSELIDLLEERFGSRPRETEDSSLEPRQYDVIVVGGGPAGVSAAIYSARKGLKTAIVAERVGGQVAETVGIENLIGTPRTEGVRLSADLERHLRGHAVDLLEHRRVERIESGDPKRLVLKSGEVLESPTVVVATGARWRELGIPGEREYLGRGVAFCPHCDGPFYRGKRVAVIGGGNSGVEAAIDLAGICAHVTLFEFMAELKADAVLVNKLKALPNATVVTNARATEIVGDSKGVTAVRYRDRPTDEAREVGLDGVFVQIGLVPNSAFVEELVETNRFGEVVIDGHGRTSVPGIYAAGDVTTVPFKQIVIAMGEGAKAALTAFEDRMRA